jgi:hypothetical protein
VFTQPLKLSQDRPDFREILGIVELATPTIHPMFQFPLPQPIHQKQDKSKKRQTSFPPLFSPDVTGKPSPKGLKPSEAPRSPPPGRAQPPQTTVLSAFGELCQEPAKSLLQAGY